MAEDDHSRKADPEPRLLCALPPAVPVILPQDVGPNRAFAIRVGARKWVNGTVLHYCFLDRTLAPNKWMWLDKQKEVVRWAFGIWKAKGIGLSFKEITESAEAELTIGCLQDNRSWSYVGTDVLSFKDLGRTMNYGWDLTTAWGRATALHEIGHAIGLSHEHQSPKSGIVWNVNKVYEYFRGPPNHWKDPDIKSNILDQLDPTEVEGSDWDASSIMEYPFEPGLITSPKPYDTLGIGENTVLSAGDVKWATTWYPTLGKPEPISAMQLRRMEGVAGQQFDYVFEPEATREYKVQVLGKSDCKVVIFEEREGVPRYFAGEDDSGQPTNATIEVRMVKGRQYVIRVRLNYIELLEGTGIVIT